MIVKISPKIETKEDRGWSPVIYKCEDIYTTKDGHYFTIEEMTTEHIQNAIRFLSNKRYHFEYFNLLITEIHKRGYSCQVRDGAVYFK